MRTAVIDRRTAETDIHCELNLDGKGDTRISTGIGFFDHMMTLMAFHGRMDLVLKADGDLDVDDHHTIEDCGIVLGEAIRQAVGDKKAIRRFGSFILPMDETLVLCAVDLSGRPYLNYDVKFSVPRLGEMDTEMVREFFYAVSYSAAMNLHMKELDGLNNHHIAEACFKAFGKALDEATSYDPRLGDAVWSTKGSL